MFGTLGGQELILILVIALIVFGPRKLPEIGKSMGKMLVEFRRASNEFKRTVEDEVEADKAQEKQKQAALASVPPGSDSVQDPSGAMAGASNSPASSPSPGAPPSEAEVQSGTAHLPVEPRPEPTGTVAASPPGAGESD